GHLLAVDQDDQRGLGLHAARVETGVDVQDVEAVLAVGGEDVREAHAAARAERVTVAVAGLIAGLRALRAAVRGEVAAGELGYGFADGTPRRQTGRRQILFQKGRRDAQGAGDVVEALHLDLRGQHLLRID